MHILVWIALFKAAFSTAFLCHGLSGKGMLTMNWDKNFFLFCLIMAMKFCIYYIKVLGFPWIWASVSANLRIETVVRLSLSMVGIRLHKISSWAEKFQDWQLIKTRFELCCEKFILWLMQIAHAYIRLCICFNTIWTPCYSKIWIQISLITVSLNHSSLIFKHCTTAKCQNYSASMVKTINSYWLRHSVIHGAKYVKQKVCYLSLEC